MKVTSCCRPRLRQSAVKVLHRRSFFDRSRTERPTGSVDPGLYFAPYMALYPDLVPAEERGRSQGSVGVWRELGLGGALVLGGLLLTVWRPLPFIVAAAVLLATTLAFALFVAPRGRGREDTRAGEEGSGGSARALLRDQPGVRRVLIANSLWETALNALRAFVVVFFTVGLGRSASFSSLMLGIVAVAAVVAAPLSGVLADRIGHLAVMRRALWVYAVAMVAPLLTQSLWIGVVVAPGVVAAVIVMTLPYGLLMERLPETAHGAAAG